MDLLKYYSQFIDQQFPEYYRTDGPTFVQFVKAYYEWMEETGQITEKSKSLREYWDIDTTLPEYIKYFNNTYLAGVPNNIKSDKRLVIKHVLDVYRAKGTEQGFRLLFRLLYNEDIDIYIPGKDIFKPSDGIWYVAKYIEVTDNVLNKTLVGKVIKGSISAATGVVEAYITRIVDQKIVHILFLSNIIGTFVVGEKVTDIESFGTVATLDATKIKGSLGGINVDGGGQQFDIGDIIRVVDGNGIEAFGRVSGIATGGGAIAVTLLSGGTKFTLNAEPIVTKIANTAGEGVTFAVGGLSSIESLTYSPDLIIYNSNTVLVAGNVVSVNIVSGGTGYTNSSIITFTPQYYISGVTVTNTGISYSNADTVVFGGSGTGAAGNVYTDDSGRVLAIDITNPGRSYNTATASITSGTGTGATLTVSVANTGTGASANVRTNNTGVITSIINVVGGSQYVTSPNLSISIGSAGSLTANVFTTWNIAGNNSTWNYSRISNSITFTNGTFGTISSLANVSLGLGYTATPTLKARDLIHVANLTGNVTWSNSTPTITGVGTNFTFWFSANTVIRLFHDPSTNATPELRIVTAVANDTSMTGDGWPLYTSNSAGKANPSYYLVTSIFSPDQLLEANGSTGGFNEFISAAPNFGAGIVSNIELKQSGFGYIENEPVTMYRYGIVSNVNIIVAGSGYTNGDSLSFIGGTGSFKIAQGSVLTNNSGAVSSIVFANRGAGYLDPPVVMVASNTGSGALLSANVGGDDTTYAVTGTTSLIGQGRSTGYWRDTRSFANADKYIQDSYYYQEYSYEIQTAIPQSSYDTIVRTVYHPAGMELFGKSVILDSAGNTSIVVANTETVTVI